MSNGFQPTEEQQAILGHDPKRHARVLAGPGTGKSATLVAFLDQLLAKEDAPRVRLLTFTRAATAELAEKVASHPTIAIERPSTIHSFAISALLRNPGAGDFPKPLRIPDDWERDNVVYPTLARRAGVRRDRISTLVREMAANWEALGPRENPKVDPADRSRFLGSWNEHREVYGYTLLSELPFALLEALRNHPDLKGVDYDLIVVDEYQDLNASDLEVLKMIGERGAAVIGAGDDDQSIYSFRKAAPEGIRRFLDDYPGAADYALSVTQRCGRRIIEWADYVIQGDPDRPTERGVLTSAEGAPDGEVALLSFPGNVSEPRGIARLVKHLIEDEQIHPSEILILLHGDWHGGFSVPIKTELEKLGVACSDPEAIARLLAESDNRRLLEYCRLIENPTDSLAWASLLRLTPGVGDTFFDYVYEQARGSGRNFAEALVEACIEDSNAPAAPARKARELLDEVLTWLEEHPQPIERPGTGWGAWIIEVSSSSGAPAASDELKDLLLELDGLTEADQAFGRFLGQIFPLGKDLAASQSTGVRIMTMATAKGLTVRATIVASAEQGIVPRPDADPGEERRLLYVAMTRSREFLYLTWARRRRGPTARSGRAQVQEARRHTSFVQSGPVKSQDGDHYITERWGQ
jgi:DNA helicase II / ATP-dependent DNA helicase PcrA